MRYIGLIFSLFILFSCSVAEDAPQSLPDQSQTNYNAFIQIISQNEFDNLADDEFSIEDVSINQDCLSVTISDSGCNPENWRTNLLTT